MQPVAESESSLSPTTPGGQRANSEQFVSPPALYSPSPAPAALGPPPGQHKGPPPAGPIRAVVSTEPTEVQVLLEELKAQRAEAAAERKERDVERREERDRAASQQNSIALLVSQGQQQAAALVELQEALKKKNAGPAEEEVIPFVPHYREKNPHAERPKFTDSDKPQLFTPSDKDVTWKLLVEVEKITAAGWEYKHSLATCSYLKDLLLHQERCFPRIAERLQDPEKVFFRSDGATVITVEEDLVNLAAIQNTSEGIYTNLANKRCSLLQLKAAISDKFSGPAESEKRQSLIRILEDEVYGLLGGLLPDNIDDTFKKCLEVYSKKTDEARLKAAAAAGAKAAKAPAPAPGPAPNRKTVPRSALPIAE